jgi:hypothetical protein
MKWRLFTLVAGLSLAGAVAAGVLWARSLQFPANRAGGDVLNLSTNDPRWWVISRHGTLTLCRQYGRDWGREFPGFDRAGFKYGGLRGPNGSLYNLAVPHWFVVTLLAMAPVGWAVSAWRRRHLRRPGVCRSCGYDLRGNVSGVCPECGAAASAPAAGHASTARA